MTTLRSGRLAGSSWPLRISRIVWATQRPSEKLANPVSWEKLLGGFLVTIHAISIQSTLAISIQSIHAISIHVTQYLREENLGGFHFD